MSHAPSKENRCYYIDLYTLENDIAMLSIHIDINNLDFKHLSEVPARYRIIAFYPGVQGGGRYIYIL